jgi:hypothetical protein
VRHPHGARARSYLSDLPEPGYFGVPFSGVLVLGFRARAGRCMSLLFGVEANYPHLMADLEALIATEFLPVGVPPAAEPLG